MSGQSALFESCCKLHHFLPRLPELAQQITRAGFGLLGAHQRLSSDRLMACGLRAQFAIGPGLALELLA